MKKQDLISILREQPHNKKVRVFGSNSWFAMDSTSIAASLIDWLIYECKVDNEQDIFNLEIDGEELKHLIIDKPAIFYIHLDDCKPNARTLKMLEHTDWQQWLKDLRNNRRIVDIKLNFNQNAEFIPIY